MEKENSIAAIVNSPEFEALRDLVVQCIIDNKGPEETLEIVSHAKRFDNIPELFNEHVRNKVNLMDVITHIANAYMGSMKEIIKEQVKEIAEKCAQDPKYAATVKDTLKNLIKADTVIDKIDEFLREHGVENVRELFDGFVDLNDEFLDIFLTNTNSVMLGVEDGKILIRCDVKLDVKTALTVAESIQKLASDTMNATEETLH